MFARPRPGPVAGRWLDGEFRNAHGRRRYRLYVPIGYAGRPVPLVVLLHGCTQTAPDFAAATHMQALADRDTFLVLYPEQAQAVHARRCWQWFDPKHQQRGRGEPSILAGLTRRVMREYGVDAHRVYVAGLSAGGAMAAVLASTYPDVFAAVGVHSGLPYRAGDGLLSAWLAMHLGATPQPDTSRPIPLIVFHGDADQTVSLANAKQLVAQWAARYGFASEPNLIRRRLAAEGYAYTQSVYDPDSDGRTFIEQWVVHGLGHAWSGGSHDGGHADPLGPDASAEMVRFFSQHAAQSKSNQSLPSVRGSTPGRYRRLALAAPRAVLRRNRS